MEILFRCIERGRKLYGVRRQGIEIFVGTRDECGRFLELHRQKVGQEHLDDLRTPRSRPHAVRTYRVSKRMHA